MLTRLLHACGLYLGAKDDLMPAQADNPDGFWEHLGFVALNDELLNELGGAWDLPPKPDENFTHVHDIFLPFEYPRDWVMEEFRFWTEQYLLQAFLTFNSEFEVLMANNYLSHYYEADLKATFPNLNSWIGGSFWMRRKSGALTRAPQAEHEGS